MHLAPMRARVAGSHTPRRTKPSGGISKSQAGFFSIVVLPQLQSFCTVFPACRPMMEQAQANYRCAAVLVLVRPKCHHFACVMTTHQH